MGRNALRSPAGGAGDLMLIPVLSVREAVDFHTRLLDFQLAFAWPEESPIYAGLVREGAEMRLALAPQGKPYGHCSAVVVCDDVDRLFATYLERGLKPLDRPESPVHRAPLDQSWGTREVYIDDPSGNTIIFQQR